MVWKVIQKTGKSKCVVFFFIKCCYFTITVKIDKGDFAQLPAKWLVCEWRWSWGWTMENHSRGTGCPGRCFSSAKWKESKTYKKRSRQERGLHKRKQIVKERPSKYITRAISKLRHIRTWTCLTWSAEETTQRKWKAGASYTINLELKLASFDHSWVLHVVTITVTVVLL